jgi:hypothetical protein
MNRFGVKAAYTLHDIHRHDSGADHQKSIIAYYKTIQVLIMKQLTNQKQTFISEYLIDLNGRQAAIRSGYSPESAEKQAYRLLNQPAIKAIIAGQMEARLERLSISADWILSRLKAEALDRSENSSGHTGPKMFCSLGLLGSVSRIWPPPSPVS